MGRSPQRLGWHLRYLGEVLCRHVMGGSGENPGERYLSSDTTYYLARNPILFARSSPYALNSLHENVWSAVHLGCVQRHSHSAVQLANGGRYAMVRGMSDGLFGQPDVEISPVHNRFARTSRTGRIALRQQHSGKIQDFNADRAETCCTLRLMPTRVKIRGQGPPHRGRRI